MALHTFPSQLVVDKATGRGVAGAVGTVTDRFTGAPVDVLDSQGNPKRLLTNHDGYIEEFRTSDQHDVIVMTFGRVSLTGVALEIMQKASEAPAQLSALTAQYLQDVANQNTKITNLDARVEGVEALAGLSPATPVDGQTANLIEQPGTLTNAALSAAIVDSATPQSNYVELCEKLSSYSTMTVTKMNSAGELAVKCLSTSGDWVTYRITGSSRYQYVGIVTAKDSTGSGVPANIEIKYAASDLTATNFTMSGLTSTPFTTQVGAIWTRSITTTSANSTVRFMSLGESRGGIWKISLDGTALTKNVTTWGENVALDTELFTIPTAGTYTVRGEFMGDDPDHEPSTGPGTSRGWFRSTTAPDPTTLLVTTFGIADSTVHALSGLSNKDFALSIQPTTGGVREFVPYHGTQSESFASATKYYNAGAPFKVNDLPLGVETPVESFEWVQHIYGRNSFTGTQNLLEVWTTQRITANGVFSVAGRWKPLVAVLSGSYVYHAMIMASLPLFDEAISTNGGTYVLDGATAPQNIQTAERFTADGWAFLSSTADVVGAVQYGNRLETVRAGDEEKPSIGTFIELRSGGTMAKVYPPSYASGVTIPAGRIHRFSADYFYGVVPGIHNALTLS